jgi:hypothetical protein
MAALPGSPRSPAPARLAPGVLQHPSVDSLGLTDEAVPPEPLGTSPRLGAHPLGTGEIPGDPDQGLAERVRVAWDKQPVDPSRTSSGTPPTDVETTGRPVAIASRSTLGNPS